MALPLYNILKIFLCFQVKKCVSKIIFMFIIYYFDKRWKVAQPFRDFTNFSAKEQSVKNKLKDVSISTNQVTQGISKAIEFQ